MQPISYRKFYGAAEMYYLQRLKGKQVRDLRELVTVNTECFYRVVFYTYIML